MSTSDLTQDKEDFASCSDGASDASAQFKNIFQTTFLFSFVKVFQIVLGVVRNKIVALLLGAEGVGVIGLFNSTLAFIQTGTSLGVHQSAVRDVSEANGQKDEERFSRIISLTNKLVLWTGTFGLVATVLLSPLLSVWTFGNYDYTLAYVLLASVVAMQTYSNGQLAILTGMRRLRALAKASMIGSVVGLITSVPLYFVLGQRGIVPSLILAALSALIVSTSFVRKIDYRRIKFSFHEFVGESSTMVKMGVSLMLVSFSIAFFNLVVSAYIRSHGSLEIVGYYNAGTTIISSYFGIVITAMTTDYYPRISAVNADNKKLMEEVNRQSAVGLVMCLPLVTLFVFCSPLIVQILYSKDFLNTIYFTDWAIFGTIITVCSNSMGMILLAKQASRIFVTTVLLQRFAMIFVYLFLYRSFGLSGLGIAYMAMGALHFAVVSVVMYTFYGITFSRKTLQLLAIVIVAMLLSIFARHLPLLYWRLASGALLIALACAYSYWFMKKEMGLDLLRILRRKLK